MSKVKRSAPSADLQTSSAKGKKKVKFNSTVDSREISPRPALRSNNDDDDDDSDEEEDEEVDDFVSFDEDDLDEMGDFDDLEDDEKNEFEMDDEPEGAVEDGDEEDDLIGDDGQDLYADLDKAPIEDDDSEAEDEDEDEVDSDEGVSGEDDDDDGGEGWSTVPSSAPNAAPTPARKVRNSRAPKALTAAELRALAFAELTASPISNVVSTQVTSVLEPITPPAPAISPLQPLLKSLHAHFVSMTPQKPRSLKSFEKKGFGVPPVEGLEGKWGKMDLDFSPPKAEDIRVVGRWAWGGGFKVDGAYIVDMAVGMPEASLEPRDYLSPRFTVKSTHYLVTLASSLPASLGPVRLSYTALGGAQGYALEICSAHVKGTAKLGLSNIKGAVLRIRVVWPGEALAHSKLSPVSNVVRPASADASDSASTSSFPPTPFHTTALHLSSLSLLTSHLKYHHALASAHASYPPAVRLLQAWASRRSYGASLGFTSEFWAWCVARTLGWGARASDPAGVALGGEAWATWRKAVEWLAGINWVDGIWFRTEGDKAYEKDQWKTAFKGRPLFVDPTGTVNLAAGIDLATLEMLKQDAKSTIAFLLAPGDDEKKFESAFLREPQPVERFDNYARIVMPDSRLRKPEEDDALDYADGLSYTISTISATLSRALGNRVKSFQLRAAAPASVPFKAAGSSSSTVILELGLLLDATESGRLVDQGPSAEDDAACAEFSSFWGPKSELRRFKDGAIVESVVWDEPSKNGLGTQRSKVVGRIIEYILQHRHGLDVKVFAAPMDHLLVEPEPLRRALYLEDAVATGKGFTSLLGAFDALSKELKELAELPLPVSSVQPSTPALRYSSTFVPSPRRLKDFEQTPASSRCIEMHDIHLTLESSGRWPDDLEGIQKIKAAFLTKIGEQLEQTRLVLTTNVVFDLDARPIDDNVALEILMATGFAFRARIHYDRSLLLLKERAAKMGDPAVKEPSMLVYEERYVHSPRHHAAISTLQHHFPSYSPTVRLVKRWCSSHLLSHFVAPELLELISASVFLDSLSPFEPPQSGSSGFARVMALLSKWKWKDEPLCVPLYTFQLATTASRRPHFPPAEASKANALFESTRIADLGRDEHAWVITTEEDLEGKVWGRSLGKVVAARIKGLAKATLKTMNQGVVDGSLVAESLFLPPMTDYDFVLHVDSSLNPRHFQSISPDPKALSWSRPSGSILAGSIPGSFEEADDDSPFRLGYDPVTELVKDLNTLFPDAFKLFHSPSDSSIGGVWNPSTLGARPFKVGLGVPLRPVGVASSEQQKPKVELDKMSLLKQIERVGRGLIMKFELLKK